MAAPRLTKPCAACGRTIQWRKKWERDWESIRYCSAACRRDRADPAGGLLEAAILDLLSRRDPRQSDATICPSEAARAVAGDDGPWRELLEPARRAARRLVVAGRVEITQAGRVVDPSSARGPIRIRLRRNAT
ncbi:MAG: DUF2256 and DUF3253 domain-containing protein [Phycisphaerales bacterium]|nr:DUF2256 and DUF3253 domain-containing protein [Phycisphaerales bacterium]